MISNKDYDTLDRLYKFMLSLAKDMKGEKLEALDDQCTKLSHVLDRIRRSEP